MTELVLVTGGLGFVGSHVVDALLSEGFAVRVVDCALPAAHTVPPAARDDVELLRGDLRDPAIADAAVAGVTAVSHQAAMVGLGVDFGDVAAYVAHNDLGTAELLRALAGARFGGRLVIASSMTVYGEGSYNCARHGTVRPPPRTVEDLEAGRYEPRCPTCGAELEPRAVAEDDPVAPRNVYAATKLHQEHLAEAFARETPASTTCLRYHNVYGARMPRDTPYAGVASIVRSALEAGRRPRIFEDGGQLRNFVEVTDVARANVIALDRATRSGVYNVASGEPRTVGEMAAALAAELRPELLPEIVRGYRLGDVRHVFASPARAAEQLGFRAEVGFAEGMASFARAPLRPIRPA